MFIWEKYIEELNKIENMNKRHRTPEIKNYSIESTIMTGKIELAIKEPKKCRHCIH